MTVWKGLQGRALFALIQQGEEDSWCTQRHWTLEPHTTPQADVYSFPHVSLSKASLKDPLGLF